MKLDGKPMSYIVFGITLLLLVTNVYYAFEMQKLNEFLHKDCPLPPEVCPVHTAIPLQSIPGFIVSGIMFVFGVFLYYRKDQFSFSGPKVSSAVLKSLDDDEKALIDLVKKEDGGIFQADLVEKSDGNKVKVSRILDKLELKGLIERKRHGMSNFVVLKGK